MTEKLASELAVMVGVPAARVDLAERAGTPGCLVEDLRWSGGSQELGQTVLAETFPDYDKSDPQHRGHTVANVRTAVSRYAAPPLSPTPEAFTAFDVFTGYLVFDALIANGDRHDGNWAVLVRPPGDQGLDALCGSYDHASSFGFNLSDHQRSRCLSEQSVESWARKRAARQFEHGKGQRRQSLVEVARSAAELCPEGVQRHWHDAVQAMHAERVGALLNSAPGLSPTTIQFTQEVIMINRRRLLDALR